MKLGRQLSARSSPELTPRKPAAEKLSASPQEEVEGKAEGTLAVITAPWQEPADSLAKQLRALQAAKAGAPAGS